MGLQRKMGVREVEEVKFVEISAEVNTYRDAVRFKNSGQLLYSLCTKDNGSRSCR